MLQLKGSNMEWAGSELSCALHAPSPGKKPPPPTEQEAEWTPEPV